MFLGKDTSTEILKDIFIIRKDYGYRLFEYNSLVINIDELMSFLRQNRIQNLFLSVENNFSEDQHVQLFKLAEENRIHISLIPGIAQNDFFFYNLSYIQTQPVLNQAKYPLDYYSNFLIKRTFDILFSSLVLLLFFSWVYLIITILIKTTGKGPVFSLQKRYGCHDKVFNCINFTTTFVNDKSAAGTSGENDIRIVKIGRFLSKTRLDKLPQFINVWKGDMSVVGPDCNLFSADNYYRFNIRKYHLTSMVGPGITGLAQLDELQGIFTGVETYKRKQILADSFYIRNWSFALDLVIILKSAFIFFLGKKRAK